MNRTFVSIQFLRAFAILGVFIYHSDVFIGRYTHNNYILPASGILSVVLFFIISGFIMNHLITIQEKYFFLKRILRIYPIFIIAIMIALFVKVLFFGSVTIPDLIYKISLLPFNINQKTGYALGVEWTLVYEVFFYFICFIIFPLKMKYRNIIIVLWLFMILVVNISIKQYSDMRPLFNNIILQVFNIPFIVGFLTYSILTNYKQLTLMKIKKYIILVIIPFVLILDFMIWGMVHNTLYKVLLVSILNAIVIILLLVNDEHFSKKSFLYKVGNNSYGIYLLHVTVITVGLNITNKFFGELNLYLISIVLLISFFLSYQFGAFDNITHRFFKNLLNKGNKV